MASKKVNKFELFNIPTRPPPSRKRSKNIPPLAGGIEGGGIK